METPDLDNPRLWRMALELSPGVLHAVITSTVADSSLIYRRLPLDTTLPLHKALEEIVYATPELLADYGKIDILIDNESYTLVPDDLICDSATIADITQLCKADGEAIAIETDSPVACAKVIWAMPEKARQFLSRTFRNAPVSHSISMLLKYWSRKDDMSNRARVFAYLTDASPRRIDLAAFDAGGHLVMATTKTWTTDTDALYYILACARLAGFDVATDELLLCGDSALRMSVTPLLSRYMRHVMPLIFPSAALRAGKEAFKAPFPLIILPLCE